MALVNPNIAMSFRQPDIQAPNALAQFAQIQQIQGGRQAQELAQYQLGAAQRGEAREVARINALAGAGTDETAVANALLRSGDIAGYSAFVKAAEDRRTQKLTQQKTEGEIAGQPLARQKTQGDIDAQQIVAAKGRADAFSTALAPLVGAVQAKKPITHQDVFAQANRLVSQGLLRKEDLYSIPINVAELPNFVMNMASSTENSRKALETYLPKALVAGGDVINVNPLAEGGIGKPLSRVSMTEAQIAQNRIAQEQLGVSQGQLSLALQKFAWEKANPGFELKEAEDGSIVGVNKRTLQAFPVTMGGAAPVAAPAMPGAGMPGPRVPAPATQVIPGMPSVLDQPAPALAAATVAGSPRQLIGKGTAMTEAQSKSAMFGAAMNQANEVISKVERDGTTTAPVAVSVLQGLAKLSPQFLGSGENAANAIESIFRQDPTSLLGPDVNQQKLGQAQVAFATAYLRATSGAAFGPSEVSNTIKEYFPLVGEDKAVVKQKALARKRAIDGMKISTTKQGQNYINKSGADENDPLGLGIRGN